MPNDNQEYAPVTKLASNVLINDIGHLSRHFVIRCNDQRQVTECDAMICSGPLAR